LKSKDIIIDWHKIIQIILDQFLSFMSGKIIREATREYTRYFQVDYYCLAQEKPKPDSHKPMLLPFDHLKERNIIEYKSIHQVVNEATFRQYVARALLLESSEVENNYQGKMTLTILTTRRPDTLIATPEYAIRPINEWKYKSEWIKDLDVYILVQKGMRGKKEGEALALLQVLEGEKDKQMEVWRDVLSQDLENVSILQDIIQNINQEVFMNFVMQIKEQGIEEGKIKGIEEGKIKGIEEGKIKGIEEGKIATAINMLKEGFEVSLVAKITGLSQEKIADLRRETKS
jgi:hypothetical protein